MGSITNLPLNLPVPFNLGRTLVSCESISCPAASFSISGSLS